MKKTRVIFFIFSVFLLISMASGEEPNEPKFQKGVFLGLIAVFCLVFQMLRVLTWWSGLLLIVIAVLLEFYFSSKEAQLL